MNHPFSAQGPGPDTTPSVQTDVLGEATPLKVPVASDEQTQDEAAPTTDHSEPKPAQDENQPGFMGERNLPHP